MPQVLTTRAMVTCPHGGVGTTVPVTPLLAANGGVVASAGDAGTLTCVFLPPCVGYTLRSMGLNASTIAGKPLILATDMQQSVTGLPLTIVETTTMLDDSSPAPIAPGTSAEALPAALQDMNPPTVLVSLPAVAFATSTMMPATATVTFTAQAAHALSWNLRLLNAITGTSRDVTAGSPDGLTVVPSSGDWQAGVLTVTLTMTASFLAGLGVGNASLYMTAVSQRGLSTSNVVTLVVSA